VLFFQLWDTYFFSNTSKLFAHESSLETGFIFRRGQFVSFFGNLSLDDLQALEWDQAQELILNFAPRHLPLVLSAFKEFRPPDETGDPDKSFNTFHVMEMDKNRWTANLNRIASDFPDIEVLIVTPDKEIADLKTRTFDIPFLSSIPTVLLFKEDFSEPIAIARIPTVLSENEWSFGVIRDVWVQPKWRRRGFGSIVTNRALKWIFKEQELSQAFLYVEKSNNQAVALYKKLHWRKAGEALSCFAYPSDFLVNEQGNSSS
jgi:GNAT superfamily N-acetyltransferase